jgi:hypothetical protein
MQYSFHISKASWKNRKFLEQFFIEQKDVIKKASEFFKAHIFSVMLPNITGYRRDTDSHTYPSWRERPGNTVPHNRGSPYWDTTAAPPPRHNNTRCWSQTKTFAHTPAPHILDTLVGVYEVLCGNTTCMANGAIRLGPHTRYTWDNTC